MNSMRSFFAAGLAVAFATVAFAEDKPKRLLFVTHSGGFLHSSVGHAEDVMKDLGPKPRLRCHLLALHQRSQRLGSVQ